MTSLRHVLTRRDNNYLPHVDAYTRRTGGPWHGPSPLAVPLSGSISVVMPAHNAQATIGPILDALARQRTTAPVEVIVVDDASTDRTASVARSHPLGPTVARVRERKGAGQARNLGAALAAGETIVFVDADMVLPDHVLDTLARRAAAGLVLLGFRHNLPHAVHFDGRRLPACPPDLTADHRVHWHGRPGRQLHTGTYLDHPVDARPLDDTSDLLELGHGRRYYDWDLPRMVVTCLLAVPRQAVLDVGGFHPGFTGWGGEDTHLGAALIATGLTVAPLRQVVGFHLDPPDAERLWPSKLAAWAPNAELYHRLLDQPPEPDGRARFAERTGRLLRDAEVTP